MQNAEQVEMRHRLAEQIQTQVTQWAPHGGGLVLTFTGEELQTIIAALRSTPQGGDQGAEAMRRPIAEYPREFVGHCEDPEDRSAGDYWGPDAVLFVPAQMAFYPYHEVSYVGHLEAGMWLVRDPEDPVCWGELPVPPSHFILLPPRDEDNRLDAAPHTDIKSEGAGDAGIPDEASDDAMALVDEVEATLQGDGVFSYAPDGTPCLTWKGRQALGRLLQSEGAGDA